MKDKTILYIGNFSFPYGNAAGKRVYANGKILRELGYNVIFIGMDKNVNSEEPLVNTRKEYDRFEYYNFSYPKNNFAWVKYRLAFKKLTDFVKPKILSKTSMIIYYGSPALSLFNSQLISFCRKNNIKIISDCVDWLTTKTNNPIFDLVKWADNTYQKAYANKKTDGIIAISSYLADYYQKHGCKTIIIPPLSPVVYSLNMQEDTTNHNNQKTILYAGIPFRKDQKVKDCNTLKDRIDKTIKLLYKAKENGSEFIFEIYGFNKEEYLTAIPEQKHYVEALGEHIIFHGYKPNAEIVNATAKADFTILLRDVNRDSLAGFPTKVSESISCGTPVITTRTSDLENYIVNGENGWFLDVINDEECLSQLTAILKTDKIVIDNMKRNCITQNPFYFQRFTTKFSEFLNNYLS